jgi:hypothetical protein
VVNRAYQSSRRDDAIKNIAIIVCAILVSFGLSRLLHGRSQKQAESKPAPKDTYQGLRNLVFQSSRAKLGLPSTSTPTQPLGVIMDWGLTEGTATVVAFSDGNASVYLSNGGGFIDGSSHETIRRAAQKMVAIAADFQPKALATCPLPRHAQVIFYFLTDAGVFTANAPEEELSSHRHRYRSSVTRARTSSLNTCSFSETRMPNLSA